MMEIRYDVFVPGGAMSEPARILNRELVGEKPDQTYSRMMRFRLAGLAAKECSDTYFIATSGGEYVARLWYGWGRHPEAVGNFGNFKTLEPFQRRGIGRHLLEMWHADRESRSDLPTALFCSAGKPHLVRLYAEYGFRLALRGTETGPLYCPLGNSPADFREFCERYYSPAESLVFRPASVGWRHEIDCLLSFYMRDLRSSASLPGAVNLEYALLNPEAGKAELVFTDTGRCVGWAFTPAGGSRGCCIAPPCRELPVREHTD